MKNGNDMSWFMWILVVWAVAMALYSAKNILNITKIAENAGSLNDVIGYAVGAAILLGVHGVGFSLERGALVILVFISVVTLVLAFVVTKIEAVQEAEEDRKETGKAAMNAAVESLEKGESYLDAGIKAAESAEEEYESGILENVIATVISLILLLPNVVAAIVGFKTLL